MSKQLLNTEEIAIPDIKNLVIEDNTPVDNFQSEKQQRLLVEPLYSSWSPSISFIAAANVGLFYTPKQNPLVPDVFLSLDVEMLKDWSQKQNRSYFFWELGKAPEVAIEIVSNSVGGELKNKKDDYARMGIAYYVVFDPLRQLQAEDQMNASLLRVYVLTANKYIELSEPYWLETVKLGLSLWEGKFEGQSELWLRWCNQDGVVIPTGAEDRDRARQRAKRLAERLKAIGIDPDEM